MQEELGLLPLLTAMLAFNLQPSGWPWDLVEQLISPRI